LYQVIATDQDNDPLTYSLVSPPSGMTVSTSGLVSWTPTASQVGNRSIQVQVADGRGGTYTQSYTLSVVALGTNHDPVITTSAPTLALAGTTYVYQPAATDADNDPLTWSLDKAPLGMVIDPVSGTVFFTPTT